MSAFVCSEDHFKALAIFAASQRGGYGAGHVAVDPRYIDGLHDAIKALRGTPLATAYANILYAENIRSCFERYPQDWLPIGQFVRAPTDEFYLPHGYDSAGNRIEFRDGQIVEHLSSGGVAVKFDRYPHVTDYSAREAARFSKCY